MKTDKQPTRKTTKKILRHAVDSFLYRYDWLTGGTAEEVARQAPRALPDLEAMAAEVAQLAANPNKAAAGDDHLMKYATEIVPSKLALYRRRVPGTAEHAEAAVEAAAVDACNERAFAAYQASEKLVAPSNVIPFRRTA